MSGNGPIGGAESEGGGRPNKARPQRSSDEKRTDMHDHSTQFDKEPRSINTLESAAKGDGPGERADEGQCPDCNAYTYEEDNFCACCGAALTDHPPRRHPIAIFCTQCGTPIDQRMGKE